MSLHSLERLPISAHTRMLLNNMGIYQIEQLLNTPISDIARLPTINSGTLQEIRNIVINAGSKYKTKLVPNCTPAEIWAMTPRTVHELKLSSLALNALKDEGCHTIAQVAQLSEFDLSLITGLDQDEQDAIKTSLLDWVEHNLHPQHKPASTGANNQTPKQSESSNASSVSRPVDPVNISTNTRKPPVLDPLFANQEKPATQPELQNNIMAMAFSEAFSRSQPNATASSASSWSEDRTSLVSTRSDTKATAPAVVTEPAKEPTKEPAVTSNPAAAMASSTDAPQPRVFSSSLSTDAKKAYAATSSTHVRRSPVFGSLFSNKEEPAAHENSTPAHQPRVFGSSLSSDVKTANTATSSTHVRRPPVFGSLFSNEEEPSASANSAPAHQPRVFGSALSSDAKTADTATGSTSDHQPRVFSSSHSSASKQSSTPVQQKPAYHSLTNNNKAVAGDSVNDNLKRVAAQLSPIIQLDWELLGNYLSNEGMLEQFDQSSPEEALIIALKLKFIRYKLNMFWNNMSNRGVITRPYLIDGLKEARLNFHPTILIKASLTSGILTRCSDALLIARMTFAKFFTRFHNQEDQNTRIFKARLEGHSISDIAEMFGTSTSQVNQIIDWVMSTFPPVLFEDYFSDPFCYFDLDQDSFLQIFPELSEEGYHFIALRHSNRGVVRFSSHSLKLYSGLWKQRLEKFLLDHSDEMESIYAPASRTIRSSRTEEPSSQPKIQNNSMAIALSEALSRSCSNAAVTYTESTDKAATVSALSDNSATRNTVITEPVQEPKATPAPEPQLEHIKVQEHKQAPDQTEYHVENQQLTPVRTETRTAAPDTQAHAADNEPVIPADYVQLRELSPRPTIDERDLPLLLKALQVRPLWFMDELTSLLEMLCIHTQSEALNTHAFRLIGYNLRVKYAYPRKYNSTEECLEQGVFSQDVIELKGRNRKLLELDEFKDLLDQKKLSLEYLEINPKTLWSWRKVQSEYGLNQEELKTAQTLLQEYCQEPFFNGKSILEEVKDLEFIKKLKGQDQLLTNILKQQKGISSIEVAGGTILSSTQTDFTLGQICEWLVSQHGTMSLDELTDTFNQTFNTALDNDRLEQELKSEHLWHNVMNGSLAPSNTADSDADNDFDDDDYELFRSEFF